MLPRCSKSLTCGILNKQEVVVLKTRVSLDQVSTIEDRSFGVKPHVISEGLCDLLKYFVLKPQILTKIHLSLLFPIYLHV
jgi:hypothetical protein